MLQIKNIKFGIRFLVIFGLLVIAAVSSGSILYKSAYAQGCVPGPNLGQSCGPDASGRIGTIDSCGLCSNLGCPGQKVFCDSSARCEDPQLDNCTNVHKIYDRCTGCRGCQSNYADCDGNNANGCERQITTSCTTGGQAGTCSDSCCTTCNANPQYVSRQFSEPGTDETGFIRIQGNIRSTNGDIYLNSGRKIQINNSAGAELDIGNNESAGAFHLRVRAPDNAISELVLKQGETEYWALSLRAPSRNFEIWRKVGDSWGTTPVFAIDYNTGNIRIGVTPGVDQLRVFGNVSVAGNMSLERDAGLFTGAISSNFNSNSTRVNSRFLFDQPLRLASTDTPPATASFGNFNNMDVEGTLYYNKTDNKIYVWSNEGGTWDWDQVGGGITNITTPSGGGLDITGVGVAKDIALYDCGVGQILHVNSSGNWECQNAPTAGATYTAGDYVTIGADNRISATHDGCFGPVFAGESANIFNESVNGYRAADNLCGAGKHICTTDEIIGSIRCGATIPPSRSYWIIEGPPSYTAPANDCIGWTSNDPAHRGAFWSFDANGGVGWLAPCSSDLKFACCQ